MKPFLLTLCLLLHTVQILSAQQPQEMITKVYHLHTSRWSLVSRSMNQSGDPFGGDPFGGAPQPDLPWAKSTNTQQDIQTWFSRIVGLNFPEGSWIRVIETLGAYTIVMHNTPSEHAKMRLAVPQAVNVSIHLREVSFETALIEQEERKQGGHLSDEQLFTLWKRGNGTTLSRQSTTTQNGVNAIIEMGDEIIFPTQMQVSTNAVSQVEYGKFETRDTGTVLNVTPTVNWYGNEIDLVLLPETVKLKGPNPDHPKALQPTTPIFSAHHLTTSVKVKHGVVKVISQTTDTASDTHRVFFVTAEVVDANGKRVPPLEASIFTPEEPARD